MTSWFQIQWFFSHFFCASKCLTMLPLKEGFLYNRKPSEKTKQKSPGLSGTFTQTKNTPKAQSFPMILFTPCPTSTWVLCVPGGRTRNSLPCDNCHRKSECKSVHRPYQGFFAGVTTSHRSANEQGVIILPTQTMYPENSKELPKHFCILWAFPWFLDLKVERWSIFVRPQKKNNNNTMKRIFRPGSLRTGPWKVTGTQ